MSEEQSLVKPRKCYITDTLCLTARAQENVSVFVKGLEDVPTEKLEPLCIEHLKKEKDGLIFEALAVRNEGFKDLVIDELRIDMASNVMRLVFHSDFKLKGQYKMDGLLFKMPISGEGDMEITMNNTNIVMVMPFEIYLDSLNRSFMDLKNFTYNFDVKDSANFNFSNLFYGDQEKSDHIHTYFVENWRLVIQVFGPMIFDDVNPKVFNALATFMRSKPLQDLQL
ncbi:juvenile hormone binding protein wdS3-0639 precursor [Danaus plexippus plexippus]|uniref:Juvenile hormone binding protein wdS3-0639 n=1 Tax=Danaus plexippus plexippus TaxID=278856 RepID=A0A212F9D5_DANPL|nr:juvenile hormone binding protein wdS3-0639 precursor [Danaus plexippus plexippus]